MKKWTDEETARAVALAEQGKTCREIAEDIGSPRNAASVYKRLLRIGEAHHVQRDDFLTDAERRQILELRRQGLFYGAIATRLGRCASTVRRVCLDAEVAEDLADEDLPDVVYGEPTHPLRFTPEQIARAQGKTQNG